MNTQRLIFCGTGGYHPSERRHTASLLLPDIGVAFDAGTGFFRVPERTTGSSLDIFLTHAHLDHICGLTFILVPMILGQLKPVRVFGSESTLHAVRTHLLATELFPVEPEFVWHVLEPRITLRDGSVLTSRALEHPGGSLGFRIDWPGRSFAYITDTTAPGNYADFVRDVDLLVHECYFPDEQDDWARKTGHSASTPVARLAKDAAVKRLILVHTDPRNPVEEPVCLREVRDIFPNAELAEDLTEIEF